ncbi:hypothetical protein FCV25MIE_07255 [Fagus crenata]
MEALEELQTKELCFKQQLNLHHALSHGLDSIPKKSKPYVAPMVVSVVLSRGYEEDEYVMDEGVRYGDVIHYKAPGSQIKGK